MKIEKKLDVWFWFLMNVLPIVCYFISYFKIGNALPFSDFMAMFRFDYISELMTEIFNFGGQPLSTILIDMCSWLVMVELVHILVDALLFIFRVVRNWLEGGIYDKM